MGLQKYRETKREIGTVKIKRSKKLFMRKLIATINMTLDGFYDHTAIIPDDEIHQHYADLLSSADTVLYGRITYQLSKILLEIYGR